MSNGENTELAAGRRAKIRDILRRQTVARVDELSEELGVSAATIRRDLADLAAHGQIRRVHGGAVGVPGSLDELVFEDKAGILAPEKQQIAQQAATFIKPGDSIFLDGGSTVLGLARGLADMRSVTVLTNSLRVVMALSRGGPRIIMTGGEFRPLSQTLVGSMTGGMIERFHVDRAFMGTIGLTDAEGLTTTDPREAYTKEQVIRQARQVILLADSTKIGKVSFARFGSPDDVDVLVTDKGGPRAELRKLRKRKMRIVCV